MSWRDVGRRASAERDRATPGQWRAPRDLDAVRAGGPARADGRPVVSFASNDYLGLTQHPAVRRGRPRGLDRWGTGAGAARLIVGSRPVHSELEAELAAWKRTRGRGPLQHRVRRQPRRAHHVRRARRARVLRRAEPRVDHRRSPARRRAARGLPPLRRRARRRAPARHRRRPRALVVTETVFSMDGDVAPVDELRRGVRAPRRAPRARRGARGARARRSTTCPTTSTCSGSARCRRRSARSAASSPARRATPSCSSTGPAPTSSPPRRRPPTPPPRWPRLRWCDRPRATSCVRGCAPTSTGCVPGIRRRSSRTSAAARPARSTPRPALLDEGLLVTAIRPPTVPPGTSRLRVDGVGRAHPRAGRPARATRCAELFPTA